MRAPQIIVLSLLLLGLFIAANKHGQPRGAWNFWERLFDAALLIALLWWGGFF